MHKQKKLFINVIRQKNINEKIINEDFRKQSRKRNSKIENKIKNEKETRI